MFPYRSIRDCLIPLCLTPLCLVWFFLSPCLADSSYDRELVIKDQARADKAVKVLDALIIAYENEDVRDFLDHVSEDRFRQDYLTFTDALYQDVRTYEIHNVDYWIQRVVSDHVKQFVHVNWEKRYETLEDSRQLFQKGVSCFVFDDINGDYLLVELKGNDLFGASLPEWTEETPPIPGALAVAGGNDPTGGDPSGGVTPPGGLPDLLVGLIYQTGSSSIDVSVHNLGTATSAPTQIRMEEMGMAGPENTFLPLQALPPGGVHTFSHFFNGPPPYTVHVDPYNTVQESNEGNNMKTHGE